MALQIEPEPTPQERAAIEKAIAETVADPAAHPRGAWWQAGVDEALARDGADPRDTRNGHW